MQRDCEAQAMLERTRSDRRISLSFGHVHVCLASDAASDITPAFQGRHGLTTVRSH